MTTLSKPLLDESILWEADELDFFKSHKESNELDLSFLKIYKGMPLSNALKHQIKQQKKANIKLPFLSNYQQIVFPASISLEQCSSEITAKFKAELVQGNSFVDLTGGMGIDSYFFAKHFKKGIVLECNAELARITSHNYAVLGVHNIEMGIGVQAENFIQSFNEKVDLIYIDPARRDVRGSKLVSFTDCVPNVVDIMPSLLKTATAILIKASPLLDISHACNELQHVKHVYCVSVDNECKELLFQLEFGFLDEPKIHAINFEKELLQKISFTYQEERTCDVIISSPKKYIYEPNASILKTGAFKILCAKYKIAKLHIHSHLYTSEQIIHDFPGRSFELLKSIKPNKKSIEALIPSKQANISMRNFPGRVDDLKKKLGLTDGGEYYVFATTNCEQQKVLLITKKAID